MKESIMNKYFISKHMSSQINVAMTLFLLLAALFSSLAVLFYNQLFIYYAIMSAVISYMLSSIYKIYQRHALIIFNQEDMAVLRVTVKSLLIHGAFTYEQYDLNDLQALHLRDNITVLQFSSFKKRVLLSTHLLSNSNRVEVMRYFAKYGKSYAKVSIRYVSWALISLTLFGSSAYAYLLLFA